MYKLKQLSSISTIITVGELSHSDKTQLDSDGYIFNDKDICFILNGTAYLIKDCYDIDNPFFKPELNGFQYGFMGHDMKYYVFYIHTYQHCSKKDVYVYEVEKC